jgi:O-antigen ligase
MALKDKFKVYGSHFYFFGFFFILFFGHKYVDIVRAPFILFILWQVATGKLSLKFFLDPIFISIVLFALTAMASNLVNNVPQIEIVQILNWLYPYGLGKYTVMNCGKRIEIENILLLLLGSAALFSVIGIIGFIFDIRTILGSELFVKYGSESRYVFTMSGTNRAGFCIGITLIVNCFFFIKNGFKFTTKNVFVMVSFPIVFAALFLIKERKTLLMVCMMIGILMLLYKKYKKFILIAAVAALVLTIFPLPQRYTLKEMVFNQGMQGRVTAWECALGLFKEKPLLGHGYPSFKEASAVHFKKNKETFRFKRFYNWGIAHNMNLNTLAETGILGFIFLNAIFISAWRFFKYKRDDPLVFVLGTVICFIYVTMQFGNFVHSGTRTTLAFLIFGLYIAMECAQSIPNSGCKARSE